jgi:hypothetical protein
MTSWERGGYEPRVRLVDSQKGSREIEEGEEARKRSEREDPKKKK